MSKSVLIVDDEKSIRSSLDGILRDEGYIVMSAATGEEAISMLEEQIPDLILLDVWLPGIDGIEVLSQIKKLRPSIPVVIMSGHGNIETAVKATKLGAFDFLEKPLSLDKLIIALENAFNFHKLQEENRLLRQRMRQVELTGNSPAIIELKSQIEVVAPTHSWILIMGENGTGKEIVARMIHRKSPRTDRPFVELNCAAIPEELIESELFGHEKGSFTGAVESKRGKFDEAHRGTLLLDEIADMSLKTQAKILRILEYQRFVRVGGNKVINVDVRVLAATNKDLEQEMLKGNFRQDLFFRLNVIPLVVPPLRERVEDIPLLVEEFLKDFAGILDGETKKITSAALNLLMQHQWPGNVRELKNFIERLVIMTRGRVIDVNDIPAPLGPRREEDHNDLFSYSIFREARYEFEKRFILRKLAEHGNNISQTAEAIGVERSHLYKKIRSLGIEEKSSFRTG